MSYTIEVVHIVNGTTKTDTYTCSRSSITMAGAGSPHATIVELADGEDSQHRKVTHVLLRHAEKITRWANE